ncbi:hypothetical protein [Pseudobacteriovorax antillogorgiicola]|uniref:Uncharacterized protein n=1 Tax=Pseudobacteriovorax antillogorgiicola TaxID=1513793 RepID=A0A1Y6BJH6_9BACT|nr:hypothetical protein [Pseudobacteriovorax antillogorgiicola]TCS56385.1 hypothetical protein EDD56_104207 [Pseudobacteriovorax antillogorgiicola]SMF06338.1 hypothetical protein SAMN06296036_104126 [Pseudobacteriovorax antillogorgiicola]
MVLGRSDDSGEIFVKDELDLSKASYAEGLSSTDFNQETEAFHVTYDRILFKSPMEIIATVLDANGYLVNLENIIACVDDLSFGVRAQLKKSGAQYPVAKSFIPCLQFRLPKKSKIGPILQRFYGEIEAYESRLAELQGHPNKKGPKLKDPKELDTQLKKLEKENKDLRDEVNELKSQLGRIVKAEASANRALVNQNLMPPNIRLAKVRDVDLAERVIGLRAGRTNINFPMVLSPVVPELDDKCLVHIEQGQVLGGFFYESKGKDIDPGLGEILWVDGDTCKIRDPERRIWLINAKHDAEREMFSQMKRGDEVLLYMLEGKVVRIQTMKQAQSLYYISKVMDAVTKQQLNRRDPVTRKQGES